MTLRLFSLSLNRALNCSCLEQVQLRHITMDSSAADAVVWAVKHSRTAKSLIVDIYDWDQQKSTAVSAVLQTNGWSLRQLHTLHISMVFSRDIGSILWSWVAQIVSQQANQDPQRWVVDMLSSASIVESVQLMGVNLAGSALARCGLPPLTHLTRLMLRTPVSPEVCSSIQQLPALQEILFWKGCGLPDMQALPPLDLACCTALQDLMLGNVLPSSLTFPPRMGIQLIWQNFPAISEVWEDICHRCTTLQLKESHSMSGPLGLSWQLGKMFPSACPMLCMLNLGCKSVGHVGLPVLLDLPRLVYLKILAIDAHVLLSERTCPKDVQLSIAEELDLTFEDVVAFAAGIDVLLYNEPETLSEGTQLLLELFHNPGIWQKTTQSRRFTHHKICRRDIGAVTSYWSTEASNILLDFPG